MKPQVQDQVTKNKIKLYHADKTNKVLRDEIFEQNYEMVVKLSAKFNQKYDFKHEKEDLQQFGSIGLLRAIQLYTGNNNAKFSTYAYIKIIGAMLDGLKKENRSKKELNKTLKLIQLASIKISQKEGRQPSLDEMMLIINVTPQQRQLLYYKYLPVQQQTEHKSVLDEIIEKEENNDFNLDEGFRKYE